MSNHANKTARKFALCAVQSGVDANRNATRVCRAVGKIARGIKVCVENELMTAPREIKILFTGAMGAGKTTYLSEAAPI